MAKELESIDVESQQNDKFPLLKDPSSSSKCERIADIQSTTDAAASSSTITNDLPNSNNVSNISNEIIVLGPCCNILTTEETPSRNFPSTPSSREPSSNTSTSSSRPWPFNSIQYDRRQRTNPLNSKVWISIEFVFTLGQVIATIVVLSSSDVEDLLSILSIWIIGYGTACLATLPLLYWRYRYRYVNSRDEDFWVPPQTFPSTPSLPTSTNEVGSNSYLYLTTNPQSDMLQNERVNRLTSQENRFRKFIEKFKVGLDCFFAIWFIVGNIWVFGPHPSSDEEQNLYRLCVAFLSLSCIAYAMPFVLCTTICCCLPCLVALLGFREEPHQSRGASPELIAALPTYNFKAQIANKSHGTTVKKEQNELDEQGGFVGEGTQNERLVSADDAQCCICLGKYKDKVELRELPCSHHFHVDCVDKWLKINASCPLCKYDIISGTRGSHESVTSSEVDEVINLR